MLVCTPIVLIFLFCAAQEVSSHASDSVTLCDDDDDDGNCYDDDDDDDDVEVQQPSPRNCESLQPELRKATETSRLVAAS